MAALYLDHGGIELREEAGALIVYEAGVRQRSIPLILVDRVVVMANMRLDTRVLRRLGEKRIPLVVVDPRDTARSAALYPRFSPDASRRVAQYRAYLDPAWRRAWSHRIVKSKLTKQAAVLRQIGAGRPELRKPFADAKATIARILEGLASQPDAGPETVTGWEGAGAAAYFEAYGLAFPQSLGFQGRNRRPPRDPVNVCLSLGYTLLHHRAALEAFAGGLDPFVGFYHELLHGRESLACDLVEPLRPHADSWVWRLFRTRRLRPEHFSARDGRCMMGKAGRQAFYEAFEQMQAVWGRRQRRTCRLLVRALAALGTGEEPTGEGALH